MIESKDITKMVTHIVQRGNGKPDATIMHPVREWALGLLVVGLMVLMGVILTITLYRMYSDSLQTEVPVVTTIIPYKGPVVADAIAYYEKERAVYKAMVGERSSLNSSATTTASGTTVGTTTSATNASPDEKVGTTTAKVVVPVKEPEKKNIPQPAI